MPHRTHPPHTTRPGRDQQNTGAGHDFVAELARDPDLVARLLATHIADAHGRCSGCMESPQLRPAWPCGPREHARLAQERIQECIAPKRRWITP